MSEEVQTEFWEDICAEPVVNDELDAVWEDIENKRKADAFEVYKEIISAIADGVDNKWEAICEALDITDCESIWVVGKVKEPLYEVKDNKLYLRIRQEDLKDNEQLHKGLFNNCYDEYYVYQVTEYEDCYHGQIMFKINNYEWLVVGYRC